MSGTKKRIEIWILSQVTPRLDCRPWTVSRGLKKWSTVDSLLTTVNSCLLLKNVLKFGF